MPEEARVTVLLLHLIAMLFMAAPLYMLIIVNERARFAVPPGYNTDRYMENIIKAQPQRCYAFLGVILVSGAILLWGAGLDLAAVAANWALLLKIGIFVVLLAL